MTWTIDILSLDGGSTLGTAVPFKSARATWSLEGPNAIEVDLRPVDVAGSAWGAGTRRLRLKQDGTAKLGAYITGMSRDGRPDAVTYRASGLGLASVLSRRIVDADYYISDNAFDVAWSLIDQAQAQAGGDMGFTQGSAVGSPPTQRRYFCVGDVVDEGINDLAARETRGFDWEISPTGAFNIWIGGRGSSSGEDLADTMTNAWRVSDETSDLITYQTVFGSSGDQACDQIWVVRSSALAADFGRREDTQDIAPEDETAELNDAGDDALRASLAGRRHLSATWIEGIGPWDFGDVWLGDRVSCDLGGVFGGTQDMRLTDISLSLEPGIHEFVEMTFEGYDYGG